jgi:hypothetical protein
MYPDQRILDSTIGRYLSYIEKWKQGYLPSGFHQCVVNRLKAKDLYR